MMPLALEAWWIRGWWCMGQRMCALWTCRCLTVSGEWGVKLLGAWLIPSSSHPAQSIELPACIPFLISNPI
ncbi:hypothetical protein B0H14DRAFT_3046108 [Mycena olivaceomarginata]|nr:hypothetical protein B0H14DRAFT_3046108 [Mycena olivaceomarginata]